jgi:hypothetical protein
MGNKHREELDAKQLAQKEAANNIYQDTIRALKTEERFVTFLKSYDPNSVEHFIAYYATLKTQWHTHGDSYAKRKNAKKNKWRYQAVACLKNIYDKKLFDLMCRWQAGEMDIEGIVVSEDFSNWLSNPAKAYSVPPITAAEVECYLAFLDHEPPVDEDEDEWQDANASSAIGFFHSYMVVGMVEEAEKFIPPWFHFYDSHFNTAALRRLPVIRKTLEEDYHDIWTLEIHLKSLTEEQLKYFCFRTRKQRLEMEADPAKMKAWVDERNRLEELRQKDQPQYKHVSIYNRKLMDELVPLLESAEVRDNYRAYTEWHLRGKSEIAYSSTVTDLLEVREYVPVESSDNYEEALEKAHSQYLKKKTREVLPFIFEEYEEAIARGLPFDWRTSSYREDMDDERSTEEIRKRLLAARVAIGEPANFDFLKKENLSKASEL